MNRTPTATLSVAIFVVFLLGPLGAAAQHYVYYHGLHPIPEAFGGEYCDTEEVHPHEYVPVEVDYFTLQDGVYYFIGDPGEEVEVQLYWYDYHHPVPVLWGGGLCYIVGPHRHWWRPHVAVHYHSVNGRYVYRGPWPRHYRAGRRVKPMHHHANAKHHHHSKAHPAKTGHPGKTKQQPARAPSRPARAHPARRTPQKRPARAGTTRRPTPKAAPRPHYRVPRANPTNTRAPTQRRATPQRRAQKPQWKRPAPRTRRTARPVRGTFRKHR